MLQVWVNPRYRCGYNHQYPGVYPCSCLTITASVLQSTTQLVVSLVPLFLLLDLETSLRTQHLFMSTSLKVSKPLTLDTSLSTHITDNMPSLSPSPSYWEQHKNDNASMPLAAFSWFQLPLMSLNLPYLPQWLPGLVLNTVCLSY